MTHILIPREPSTALLRPFVGCPQEELPQAYAAMIRIAEVQHARAGTHGLAQIEEPAAPAAEAGPTPKGWRLVPATPTREWIAAVADGVYEYCDCSSLIADILSRAPAAPALEAPAAPSPDETAAFEQWFQGEQGKPYQGMWEFARAAWMARAATAAAPQAPAAPAEAVTPPVIDERAMKEAFDSATAEGKSFNDALRAAACATIWKRAARADGAPNAVPAAMSAIATECALHAEERHSYLPNTPAQAATWRPHDWVLQAMSRAISFDRMMNQAAPAAPAVDAWLQPDDMAALQRFHETAEDDESYDIGKEAVARLCAFGCLQSHSFGRYSTTDFGDYLLDTWAGARTLPFTTAAEREAIAAQAAAKGA